MKKFMSVILSIFMLVTFASGAFANVEGFSQKKLVNNFEVELVTPDSMVEGTNTVEVIISKDGTPVPGIPVKIVAEMDKSDSSMDMDMETAAPIEKELAEEEAGEYHADIDFDGEGRWNVTVKFNDNQTAVFEVEVKQSGPNMIVIGGFLGLILLIAAILTFGRGKGKSCCSN